MRAVITLGVTQGIRIRDRARPLKGKLLLSKTAVARPSRNWKAIIPTIQIIVWRKELQKTGSFMA
jgi:hypothetical protein